MSDSSEEFRVNDVKAMMEVCRNCRHSSLAMILSHREDFLEIFPVVSCGADATDEERGRSSWRWELSRPTLFVETSPQSMRVESFNLCIALECYNSSTKEFIEGRMANELCCGSWFRSKFKFEEVIEELSRKDDLKLTIMASCPYFAEHFILQSNHDIKNNKTTSQPVQSK